MDRTDFLARSVNPLSTKVLSDSLVSLSAAFFEVWRVTYHATLFVLRSSVCLASNSVPLRTYVFTPNNHFILARIRGPNSLSCQVLSTFHVALEQSFAFCWMQKQGSNLLPTVPKTVALPDELFCEPTKKCCSSRSISC